MTHPVDIHVGAKIRQRRRLVGMTQQELADQIGTVAQQVQKYEIAANRISAGRLYDIARALETGAECFFAGLADEDADADAASMGAPQTPRAIPIDDLMMTKDAQQFLRSCFAVPEPRRKEFLSLVTALGTPA